MAKQTQNQPRVLTPKEIAYFAYRAGFRGKDLNTAVAIALAESGGNPIAYNPESAAGTRPGSGSRGLWQIYGTAHPWANNPQVFDPQANANAAFRVYMESGRSFRPWSTYNQGLASPRWNFAGIDFSKLNPGNIKINPPKISPVSQTMQSGNFAGATISAGSKPGESQTIGPGFLSGTPLGVLFGGEDQKGRDAQDLSFYIGGMALIFIGLIMLIFIGSGKLAADNPEVVKTAVKLLV